MRFFSLLPIFFVLTACERRPAQQIIIEDEPSVEGLVSTVLNGGGTFTDVPFSSLIETSTGRQVVPINAQDESDALVLAGIERALDAVLERFNRDGSPTSEESRINEVSSYFEKAILEELDRDPDFECDYPRTEEGNLQRSGYPDLLIRHLESGRVIYLDPKLVQNGSLNSSLRTFYFTPKTKTNKVLHDAHHLLVGIEHDGNTGDWKFLRWHLVDLTRFKVRLKAEFQASNKDLYRPELIVSEGESAVGAKVEEEE